MTVFYGKGRKLYTPEQLRQRRHLALISPRHNSTRLAGVVQSVPVVERGVSFHHSPKAGARVLSPGSGQSTLAKMDKPTLNVHNGVPRLPIFSGVIDNASS